MLRKQEFYEAQIYPRWIEEVRRSPHRAILMHGIMGSELFDKNDDNTIWIDMGIFVGDMEKLKYDSLSPEGAVDIDDQCIYARSTLHPPFVEDPYSNILDRLRPGRFDFDWRESIPVEAHRLAHFLDMLLEDGEPVRFITHSMGCCVLLWFLRLYDRFDDAIEQIIFCAPPFHGALKPVRVIEDGDGTPIDSIIDFSVVRQSAATFPGLFDLVTAPKDAWVSELPVPGSTSLKLQYPIRGGTNLYTPAAWTNRHRSDLRTKILNFAERYHREKWNSIPGLMNRFGDKIHVITGLNGKIAYAAKRQDDGDWRIHYLPKPQDGKISNGDGVVQFQSSFLPGLALDRYWAYSSPDQKVIHGEIVDIPEVIQAIELLLDGQNLQKSDLVPYRDFIGQIDWSLELENIPDPNANVHLNYLERARVRRRVPRRNWGNALNPGEMTPYCSI